MNASLLEKKIRKSVIEILGGRTVLRKLMQPSFGRALWNFIHIWVGIAGALLLGSLLWVSPQWELKLLIPLLLLYIGTRINAIGVQIHEASHGFLAKSRSLNDWFCNFAGAYWVLNDVESYRQVHLVHHSDLRESTDPDLELYDLTAAGKNPIRRRLLEDLTGLTALRRIMAYRSGVKRQRLHVFMNLLCQLILWLGLCLTLGSVSGTFFYGFFWLIPLFCVFPAIIRLRIVTEHFHPDDYVQRDGRFVSRTSNASPLEIYLFGCDMEYHFEHHLLPMVPYHGLRQIHWKLVREDFFTPPKDYFLSGGYFRFWHGLLGGKLAAPEQSPAT